MGRPSDWGEVFGISDPTPGEPYTVRQVAHRWDSVADAALYAHDKLAGWLRDDAVATWIGKAGDAFAEHSTELPDQLDKAYKSYRMASDAMGWWAGRLEVHQGAADRALVQGRNAKADLTSASAHLKSATASAQSAGNASALHYTGAADAPGAPTPAQISQAQQASSSAQSQVSHFQGMVHDAQARLDAARRLAVDAGNLRESDGKTTSGKIHDAADAGIKPRSTWQKIKDGAAAAWKVIVVIAKVVVAVLGIVALIIGGPLAWVVFAAALIVLADTLAKYAKGDASLLDVGLAALGCIPGVRGLTTLSELSAAFKAGGMLSAGAHLLGAGKTAIVGMAQSIRGLSGTMRTALVSIRSAVSVRSQYVVALARGFDSMARSELGLLNSIKSLPDLLRVPMPREGTEVFRIYGQQLDSGGNYMTKIGNPDWSFGSGPNGASWTPTDPATVADFRAQAGLPDENPMRFLRTGSIDDLSSVREIRLGLPLDGQPGGLPEYIIQNSGSTVRTTGVSGYNGPGAQAPGSWTPSAP